MAGEREPHPADSELLRRHTQGDHEAFGLLFSRHRDRLWAVALRTLGDTEEAADALQEAMISAFRRADSFRGDSAVTTWLHRIVVNACLDRVRRRAARPAVPAGDEHALDGLVHAGVAGEPAADRDEALDVEAALRLLPYEQRAALVLVDMLGYPVQVAAEVLDVSVGTVKSRCARGRARLVPHLSHLRGRDRAGPRQPAPEGAASAGSAPGGPVPRGTASQAVGPGTARLEGAGSGRPGSGAAGFSSVRPVPAPGEDGAVPSSQVPPGRAPPGRAPEGRVSGNRAGPGGVSPARADHGSAASGPAGLRPGASGKPSEGGGDRT